VGLAAARLASADVEEAQRLTLTSLATFAARGSVAGLHQVRELRGQFRARGHVRAAAALDEWRASRHIAGSPEESVFQPEWSPGGVLHFMSDRRGWWDLYACLPDGGIVSLVHLESADLGTAQWEFGYSTYAFLDNDRIAFLAHQGGRTQLNIWDRHRPEVRAVELPYTSIKPYLAAYTGGVAMIGSAPDRMPAVIVTDIASGESRDLTATVTVTPAGQPPNPEVVDILAQEGGRGYVTLYRPPRRHQRRQRGWLHGVAGRDDHHDVSGGHRTLGHCRPRRMALCRTEIPITSCRGGRSCRQRTIPRSESTDSQWYPTDGNSCRWDSEQITRCLAHRLKIDAGLFVQGIAGWVGGEQRPAAFLGTNAEASRTRPPITRCRLRRATPKLGGRLRGSPVAAGHRVRAPARRARGYG
jgi:hypothetical protein